MIVILRISPNKSIHESPFHNDSKKNLALMCFRSLSLARDFTDERYELIVVSDGAEEWKSEIACSKWIDATGKGNFGTFKEQLYQAANYDDETVLLVEDDYLWRPNTLVVLQQAVERLGLVFPYDHPGHYMEQRFTRMKRMEMVGNFTYRKAESNTLTFATTANFIRTYYDILTTHGTNDHEMFSKLSETEDLWCPTYSMATHCVTGLLAPNVDWHQLANVYSSHLQ